MPLLTGPLRSRVGVPDKIELFDYLTVCKQMTDVKLNCYCDIAILEMI